MNKDIRKILEGHVSLRSKLFCRGHVLSNAQIDENEYPFYGIWLKKTIDEYTLLVSPKQCFYDYVGNQGTWVLVGHVYNPFTMDCDEMEILRKMDESEDFISILNELTGVFTLYIIKDGEVRVFGDATCMQSVFYGLIDGKTWISTHTNLIGDLCKLSWNPYIKKLVDYLFFPLLGNSLPGNLTQFNEVERLMPNFFVRIGGGKISQERFYSPKRKMIDNATIADEVAKLLHNNLVLIAKKWEKPAISCTGGCDSKTTMACAVGLYDKFRYFSYISNDSEKVDAEAARTIVKSLGHEHKTYIIPDKDECFTNLEETRSLLLWNNGALCPNNKNDVRKRKFFEDIEDFDVEIKSWASEIGRAYFSKRFANRVNFGKCPSPRKCTAMYKFFLHNRPLVWETDKVFKEWLDKYFKQDAECPIDWQEQFFWEFRVPSWNGLVITGEHRYSFDITIPYNNRKIIELLVSASIKDRINDTIYSMIRAKMNPEIDKTGISVTNVKHTNNRAIAENFYYWMMTHMAI